VIQFRRNRAPAEALYGSLVDQARQPAFYATLGVPDTVDGRFDMIAVHAFLLMRRLRAEGEAARGLSQSLFDIMFADMDQNLREIGVGDLGVGKRVKAMAQAFYGRVGAYDAGLDDSSDPALAAALRRNLYRKTAPSEAQVTALATYMRRENAALAGQALDTLHGGRVAFGEPVLP
jgi:cytochrome b pre-mRNA-processing protein 3